MRARELLTEKWAFRNRNRIYKMLIDRIDSGPFDGGCIVFSRSLQLKLGRGIIVVLVNSGDRAEHAALQIENQLIDADGPLPINEFIRRFRRLERVEITDIRPIEDQDLPDAPRDEKLSHEIAKLL